MDPTNGSNQFPFLTRDMLRFKESATFSLRIESQALYSQVISIRGFTREGPFTLSHTTGATQNTVSQTFRIPDVPIMVIVADEGRNYLQGELNVALSLLINGDKVFELCRGLVYIDKSISYPVQNPDDLRPGGGAILGYDGVAPAAGANISLAVPYSNTWRLQSIAFQLVTAATVGSRRVHLTIQTGISDVLNVFSDIDQIISETKTYFCMPVGAIPDSTDNNIIIIPIPPDFYVTTGSIIKTATLNLAAGDQFGAPHINAEQWFVPLT